MKTKEVETSRGKFVLKEPYGETMADAVIKAEKEGNGVILTTMAMKELLPFSIKEHPFGISTKLRDGLKSLNGKDYFKLLNSLNQLLEFKDDEEELKNSQQPSTPEK